MLIDKYIAICQMINIYMLQSSCTMSMMCTIIIESSQSSIAIECDEFQYGTDDDDDDIIVRSIVR